MFSEAEKCSLSNIPTGLYNTGKHPKERLDEARKQAIKGIKLEIFCVGVGNVDVELLKSIATSSEPEHLIYLRNYTQLQAMDIIFTSRQSKYFVCFMDKS